MKKRIYVLNAFSLGMLSEPEALIRAKQISLEEAKRLLLECDFTSAIGHETTSIVFSKLLSLHIPFNRTAIHLSPSDEAIVFQLRFRLPEGAILTQADLENILEKGLYSLWHIRVEDFEGR